MSRVYEGWDRLVGAVLRRAELRRIALCDSLSSSPDFSSCSSVKLAQADAGECRNSGKSYDPIDPCSQSIFSSRNIVAIEYKEIKKATKSFGAEMLMGKGGSGRVYKGWIDDDRCLRAAEPGSGVAVAAKKMNIEGWLGHREWAKEINYLSQLRHPNIIKLMGYCFTKDKRILVYEFMPNGSLDNHLFTRGHQSLPWETRMKVAVGAARALSLLHALTIPVIKRGFNSRHILLDEEFNPKLTDFSLATDCPPGSISTLTTECDVYGFGVVLMELISGLRCYDQSRVRGKQNLVDWARPYSEDERRISRIMDIKLEGQYPREGAFEVVMLAFRCLSRMPEERPSMAEVVLALQQLHS